MPDGSFIFTRDEAGTVTIGAVDNDSIATLAIIPGGAAQLLLGGPSTTDIAIDSDHGLVFTFSSKLTHSRQHTNTSAGHIGWMTQTAANDSCVNTCTHAAIVGFDTDGATMVAGNDSAADVCLCAGSD